MLKIPFVHYTAYLRYTMQALGWWINGTIAKIFAYWRNNVALETLRKQLVQRTIIEHMQSLLQSVFKGWRGHVHSKMHRIKQRIIALSTMTNYRLCLIFDTWLVLPHFMRLPNVACNYISYILFESQDVGNMLQLKSLKLL